MLDLTVGRRYATSLIELATANKVTDKVYADMELLSSTIKANRDLALMLNNPIVHSDKKLNILKAIFSGKFSQLSIAFMELITKKGREAFLPGIASSFIQLYKNKEGIKTAFVKTAIPLDTNLRAEVMSLLKKTEGEKVELVEEVDKNVIGGFVLRVGDKQHDSSVSTKLRQLQNEFDKNPYIKSV